MPKRPEEHPNHLPSGRIIPVDRAGPDAVDLAPAHALDDLSPFVLCDRALDSQDQPALGRVGRWSLREPHLRARAGELLQVKNLVRVRFRRSPADASSATIPELVAQVQSLSDEYDTLLVRIGNCPEGDCPERADIEEDVATAEAERLELQAAREALGSCPECGSLDAVLEDLQLRAAAVVDVVEGWDVQS